MNNKISRSSAIMFFLALPILCLFSYKAYAYDYWLYVYFGTPYRSNSHEEIAIQHCPVVAGTDGTYELIVASETSASYYCKFSNGAITQAFTFGKVSCPTEQNADAPFDIFDDETGQCGCSDPAYEARIDITPPAEVGCFLIEQTQEDEPDKDDGGCPADNYSNNPCNVATGNKYKSQTDISGNLSFTRSYNSNNLVDLGLGKGWRSGYQKRLIISGDSLTLTSGTGRGEPWRKTGGTWAGDADTDFIITETASGFTVTKQNGDVEQYDTSGNLLSETDTQGKTTNYAYDANNQLITVTDHFGESLSFSYDANGHLETVTDAVGAVYTYEYDANDNLVTVIYPDTTTGDDSDNPRKIYHYENVDYPNHLTGITDANGDRYQAYAYDADGKAIQSEKASTSSAVGQERIQLDFQE